MKSFSLEKLSQTVVAQRKALHVTQQDLASGTGINRSLLSRLEKQDYIPSPDQLVRLANALSFDPSVAFVDDSGNKHTLKRKDAEALEKEAICFYKPLPLKAIGIRDLIIYLKNCLSIGDVLFLIFITLKLCGVISWSWVWVLAPLWIGWALVLLIIVAVALGAWISERWW